MDQNQEKPINESVNPENDKPVEKKSNKFKKYWAVTKHHVSNLGDCIVNNPATSSSIIAGTIIGTLLFIKFAVKRKK